MAEDLDDEQFNAIVEAMIEAFGDRAIAVVEDQLALSEFGEKETWLNILEVLRARER